MIQLGHKLLFQTLEIIVKLILVENYLREGMPSKPVALLMPRLLRYFKILFSDTIENE